MTQRTTSIGSDSQSGAWGEPDATTFMIRGDDYMKTRRKVPSDKAIYRSASAISLHSTGAVKSQHTNHLQQISQMTAWLDLSMMLALGNASRAKTSAHTTS